MIPEFPEFRGFMCSLGTSPSKSRGLTLSLITISRSCLEMVELHSSSQSWVVFGPGRDWFQTYWGRIEKLLFLTKLCVVFGFAVRSFRDHFIVRLHSINFTSSLRYDTWFWGWHELFVGCPLDAKMQYYTFKTKMVGPRFWNWGTKMGFKKPIIYLIY